jgi:hypothetical protein
MRLGVRLSATVGPIGHDWPLFVQRLVQRISRNSTQHCAKYLEMKRERQREKAVLAGNPLRGRHSNTLASLARNRGARAVAAIVQRSGQE